MTQPPRSLEGVGACVFDAYGTLFDFASAAARCPGVPEDRRQALTALWRDRQCHVWTSPADQGLFFGVALVVGAVMSSAFCAENWIRWP